MKNELSVASLLRAMVVMLMTLSQTRAECDLIGTAEAEIVKKFPKFDLREFSRVVSDNDRFWTLTYGLPPNMLGGVPIVTIDKKSCKVVRILHTQ